MALFLFLVLRIYVVSYIFVMLISSSCFSLPGLLKHALKGWRYKDCLHTLWDSNKYVVHEIETKQCDEKVQ